MLNESFEDIKPIDVSSEFVSMDDSDFRRFLRQKIKDTPEITFTAVIDWTTRQTARRAKACLEDPSLNIESITVRATRKQYEEDINAFESGVVWEEVF